MLNGFSYRKIVVDENGGAVDYIILEINEAYTRITGSGREVVGKSAIELHGGLNKDLAERISVYGKVAMTGEPTKFEFFSQRTQKWLAISAYSVEKGYFATVYEDITERKKLEEKNREYAMHLEELVAERTREVSNERHLLYSVLEKLPAYVVLLDKDYRMPFANKFFRERFGESRGRRCFEYLFNRSEACENCET